jgi:hypothetical protein
MINWEYMGCFKVYSRSCLEGVTNTTETSCQDSLPLSRESNPGHAEYKAGMLSIRPQCSVTVLKLVNRKTVDHDTLPN